MAEALVQYLMSAYDWFVLSVFMPTMTVVGENPWLVGIVLFVAIAVVVIDTMREDAEHGDEDAVTEAAWAARR